MFDVCSFFVFFQCNPILFTLSLNRLSIYLSVSHSSLYYLSIYLPTYLWMSTLSLYRLCCFSRLEVSAHVALGVKLTLVRYLFVCSFSSFNHQPLSTFSFCISITNYNNHLISSHFLLSMLLHVYFSFVNAQHRPSFIFVFSIGSNANLVVHLLCFLYEKRNWFALHSFSKTTFYC